MRTQVVRQTLSLCLVSVLAGWLSSSQPHARNQVNGCVSPPADLIAWWPGDANTNDIIGTNHGSFVGTPTYGAGKVGPAFVFDSDDDGVRIPHNANLDLHGPGFTADFWMRGDKNQSGDLSAILEKSHGTGGATGWAFQISQSTGYMRFAAGDGSGFPEVVGTGDVLDGAWHHIAGTWDGSTLRLYVDGTLDGAPVSLSAPAGNTGTVNIGFWWFGGRPFNGAIDEVEIFERALADSEISDMAAAGADGKCKPTCTAPPSGLVSWWPGDDDASDIVDSNHGTLQNGATFASGKVGPAFGLTGSEFVEVADSAGVRVPTAITLDAWINVADAAGSRVIVAKAQASGNWNSYYFGLSDGKLILGFDDASTSHYGYWATSAAVISANTWYHVGGTWQNAAGDVTDAKLYVDGIEQTVQLVANQGYGATFALYYTALPLYLGRSQSELTGSEGLILIDEVELFDRALDATEIADIYTAGAEGKCKPCVEAPADLVSWWSGDGHPNDVIDGHDGTLQNGATHGTGKVGQAFNLDGSNDYVSVLDSPSWAFNGGFTIDAWVRVNNLGHTQAIVAQDEGPYNTNKWIFYVSSAPESPIDDDNNPKVVVSARLGLHLNGPAIGGHTVESGATFPTDGAWHHVAVTRSGSTFTFYTDGSSVGSGDDATAIPDADTPLTLGWAEGDWYLGGALDEVEIFNRALSAAEVAAIYRASSGGKCKPLFVSAGGDQTVAATGCTGAPVTLAGVAGDPSGHPLTVEWADAGANVIGGTPTVDTMAPAGANTYTFTATDGARSASDTADVTVTESGPTVAVTSPNGGNQGSNRLFVGIEGTVQWNASDDLGISFFDVFLSLDGGTTYDATPICDDVPGGQTSCTFTPSTASNQARVKVLAEDTCGNTADDTSNNTFVIVTPTVHVMAPNMNVTWGVGSHQTVKWAHNLGINAVVVIEVSRNSTTGPWTQIAEVTNTTNTGSYLWTVTAPTTTQARIRVKWKPHPSVNDLSDVDFRISNPFVTVASPNTTVSWQIGTKHTISWKHNLGPTDTVNIELSRDAGLTWTLLQLNWPNGRPKSGRYTWTVTGPRTQQALIRVTWTGDATVTDASNNKFLIVP
ncbi:MAG: LamG domain-containing protein [Acidobacteria bacterium]|nr:LamG domain-containing protein [Acidobacteriota bacterium]